MKILLTGGSGFVGSTLCDELTRRGLDVSLLMRGTSKIEHLGAAKYTAVKGDLRDPDSLAEAVREAEVIFHVAGVVSAPDREYFIANNVNGTRHLVEAAQRHARKLRRFVYVSSLAAGGPAGVGSCRIETDTPAPISDYGASKLGGEEALRASGLPSIIVRPPAVYGPRDRGIFTFFELVSKGIRPALGINRVCPRRYSFVHVEDLVQGIVLAGLSTRTFSPAEIFYVCGDGEYSWDQTMDYIAKAFGGRSLRLPLPIPLLAAVAAGGTAWNKTTGRLAALNLDKLKELTALAWTCSNAKAKRELGFQPKWELERGLKQTADWYLERGWL